MSQVPAVVPGVRIGQPRSVHVKCGVMSAHVFFTQLAFELHVLTVLEQG